MKHDVLQFARAELDQYLARLGLSADIRLGLFADFDISFAVEDPFCDDAIAICVKDGKGHIAGSNERSVLIGVYRLLEEWGIRWVRPGKNGTYYPEVCDLRDVEIREAASIRHRTMCIEGAVSLENVLDMIEWCPKVGFNGYYIQFETAFTFFDRWYSHKKSTVKKPEAFDEKKAREYVGIMTAEIKRRGLMLHRMGHGWTCNPFGVAGNGWDEVDPSTFPDSYRAVCAEVGGKRDVWLNKPLTTQLCYSNPAVRTTIADAVIDYMKQNTDADVVHFWLGDYFNNYCECEECAKYRVSDLYVKMLNEITEKMAAEGLERRVVITNGYNKAHPPVTECISHPEKVMLMFAPISRTFSQSFPNRFLLTDPGEYVHNGFTNPRSVDENLSYLYAWKQKFHGDAVDFDYHLMWDHILDAGGEGIARVIYDDIRNFGNLGLNGYISCQLQRNSFPTSIAMTVMGKTLWNADTDFDEVRRNLYAACFGEDMAETMGDYFATLSRGFDIGRIRAQRPYDKQGFREDMQAALEAMRRMKPIAEAHGGEADPCRRECWRMVALNVELYAIIGEAILVRLDGDIPRSQEIVRGAAQLAWEKEDALQEALDCSFFEGMTRTRVTPERAIAFTDN